MTPPRRPCPAHARRSAPAGRRPGRRRRLRRDRRDPAPGAAGGGAPQGGGAPGGGAGFDAGQAGQDAKAAFAAGGAAFGAAAASLAEGAGPVTISHEGPGYPFGDLVKGGLTIVKANLIPSLAIFAPNFLLVILQILMTTVIPTSMLGIFSLVFLGLALVVMVIMPQLVCNYMAAVKEFQATGRKISIGDLMKFNDIVQRYITMFIVGVCFCLCYIPGMIVCMGMPLIVDRPEVGFMNAFKAGLAYGKRNIVPNILLCIVGGIVYVLGFIACGFGALITFPTFVCYMWLAYSLKKGEIEAAAAEDGIQLG
ncbi:MAG: hypothetical protein R3F62_31295 [Planctomycetota bacterium]